MKTQHNSSIKDRKKMTDDSVIEKENKDIYYL